MNISPTLKFYSTKTNISATTSFFAFDPYVDEFVRPIYGPTASTLLNELSLRSLINNGIFTLELSELSFLLGTGNRTGSSAPCTKQLNRLIKAGLIFRLDDNEYLVPQAIAPLDANLISRNSNTLKDKHDAWISRLLISPLSTQRRRLNSLHSRLSILGYEFRVFRNILVRSGLHPSIIGEYLCAGGSNLPAEKTG